MNKLLTAALISIQMLSVACANKGEATGGITYAVSIEPQRWLLEQIAEPDAEIVTMLRSGSDPETFEPSMAQRAMVDKASAYFATGALPFEASMKNIAGLPVVDTSAGITPIYGTHTHGDHDHDGAPDPHVWTSVSSALTMARNMTSARCEINPEGATGYHARLVILEQRLDSLGNEISVKMDKVKGTTFAVWHPSLSYFARDYGLHQLAVGQESKEMSARQLREIIDHARADSVTVFFFQKEYDSRQAATINEAIGSRLVTIDPLAYEWMQQITLIADELSRP